MSWPVIMSKLCVKTSNVGRKIITIDEIRFLCVEKLSYKCWPRDVELVEDRMMYFASL